MSFPTIILSILALIAAAAMSGTGAGVLRPQPHQPGLQVPGDHSIPIIVKHRRHVCHQERVSPAHSPTSPGCRCRRCSLLTLDECDAKEVNSLFKFLRKRKVNTTGPRSKSNMIICWVG